MTEVAKEKTDETTSQEDSTSGSSEQESKLPSCACGHTREDLGKSVDVSMRNDYNLIGWALIVFGITARPINVKWYCSRCSQVIDETSDPDDLYRYS
ncbi:MAG: hypothetical protein EP343_21415 [Deltaproteobacteria bacterium]|nr:MAG: hypothetical protein EP343_21415 [Deltaproteobacteria bacterium]